MIFKERCTLCGGFGHVPNCACRGGVDFIMGCCTRCYGEGYVRIDPPKEPPKLWVPESIKEPDHE